MKTNAKLEILRPHINLIKTLFGQKVIMLPNIYKLGPNKIRFFGSRNKKNVSSVGFVDLSYLKDKFKVLNYSRKPVLMPGNLGAFDDNGVLPSCIIKKRLFLFILHRMETKRYNKILSDIWSCKI